tara:strand:+ start:2462 stop:2689 length:228 start_codon:yes stop_codon:yes gene_type:complete
MDIRLQADLIVNEMNRREIRRVMFKELMRQKRVRLDAISARLDNIDTRLTDHQAENKAAIDRLNSMRDRIRQHIA